MLAALFYSCAISVGALYLFGAEKLREMNYRRILDGKKFISDGHIIVSLLTLWGLGLLFSKLGV